MLFSANVFSADQTREDGIWSNFVVFNQAPLEVKIGTYSDTNSPDLAVAVLWNDSVNNRIDVVRVPPPYDGSGITSQSLETSGGLFAMGDICTSGNNVVIPYIKDFNVEVARYNGLMWTTSTIPGTSINNFDNTDCATTSDGMFVGTHDLTDGETEFFKSTNGGGNYTFYGRYNSSGPFSGAIREPLVSSFGQRYVRTVFQESNGMVKTCHFSTQDNTPSFNCNNIEQLPAPMGFTFVKESGASFNGVGMTVTYNSNSTAKALFIPEANPANFTVKSLEVINNNPSQYTFQGSSAISVLDEEGSPMKSHIIWGDYFILDGDIASAPETDNNFPFAGIGGPSDGCVVRRTEGDNVTDHAFFAAANVGPDGTNIYQRELRSDPLFQDGFESGDTTSWSATCP